MVEQTRQAGADVKIRVSSDALSFERAVQREVRAWLSREWDELQLGGEAGLDELCRKIRLLAGI